MDLHQDIITTTLPPPPPSLSNISLSPSRSTSSTNTTTSTDLNPYATSAPSTPHGATTHNANDYTYADRHFIECFWKTYDDILFLSLTSILGILVRFITANVLSLRGFNNVFTSDSALFTNLPLNVLSCFFIGLICSGDDVLRGGVVVDGHVRTTMQHQQQQCDDGGDIVDDSNNDLNMTEKDDKSSEDNDRISLEEDCITAQNDVNDKLHRRHSPTSNVTQRKRANNHHECHPPTDDFNLNHHSPQQQHHTLSSSSNYNCLNSILFLFDNMHRSSSATTPQTEDECREVQFYALERRIRNSTSLVLFPAKKEDVDVVEHYDNEDDEGGGGVRHGNQILKQRQKRISRRRFSFRNRRRKRYDNLFQMEYDIEEERQHDEEMGPKNNNIVIAKRSKKKNIYLEDNNALDITSGRINHHSEGEDEAITTEAGCDSMELPKCRSTNVIVTDQHQDEKKQDAMNIPNNHTAVDKSKGNNTFLSTSITTTSTPQQATNTNGGVDEEVDQIINEVSENLTRLTTLNIADGWDVGTTAQAMSNDLLLGLRVGFCGALSTFSSWNSDMVNLLRNGKIDTAFVGYMIGLSLPIMAYRMGQNCAVYLFVWRCRWENVGDEKRGYGLRINLDEEEDSDEEEELGEEEDYSRIAESSSFSPRTAGGLFYHSDLPSKAVLSPPNSVTSPQCGSVFPMPRKTPSSSKKRSTYIRRRSDKTRITFCTSHCHRNIPFYHYDALHVCIFLSIKTAICNQFIIFTTWFLDAMEIIQI
uniref:Uncharacterized protein n=1 Tax=Ditylum brightwellii TaxID=49249 RepID=A0A7S4SCV2_9STRA